MILEGSWLLLDFEKKLFPSSSLNTKTQKNSLIICNRYFVIYVYKMTNKLKLYIYAV